MAFIYDLSDTWNNAGISWNGIKLNVTDAASAVGSKLLDLQIGSASKFTVGKTGTVTATGIIESTVGGFRFPDGTTQITRAVTSVTSTDGSVAITGTTSVDLSAVFATSASNLLLPVRNTTGATLTKGTAVYISGATGQLSTVSKAIATGDATSAQTLGLVTANIANNANGNVTLIGTITNIDTSAYTDGQQLYLSPTTAGTLTATKPYAPQHLVYMAVVEHAHPTQGKLFVKVQNGYELDELHNVSAQTPSNNHGIFYNTATSLWENKSIVTALGYTPYNSTNPAGYTTNVGTVTSVAGTGTVSGLSLTGSVTTSGSLTLGGTLILTSGQVTDGLGYTPYNATNPAGYTTNVGTVTSVSGTGTVNGLTLTGSVTTSGSLTLGGTLGNIANSQLTNSAITINGTSTALGGSISVGTVTSVAALTLGTSGTDLASSVANGTTTPVITLNVPTASATNRGALSSSDWSTFNAKQDALVSGTNIKTVGGASLLGSGDVGTIGLAYGGTGATTASGARTALGLGTAAVLNAGVSGGVATLDGSGTVPTSQLPGAVLGGLNYQGTWNASTNTPTLASSTGSKGYYYVVSVAGSTNLNGITDWKIGDWAVYDGTTWQKVDNTDAVSSVNGYTGAVVLTTSDVAQGTNLYFTQAAARGSVSAGTGISYDSGTGVITNSAPDQTVALTGAGTTVVTGTYPNFTITSNDSTVGTVTSVGGTGTVSGLTLTGTVTTSGNLTLGGTLAVTPSNFASQTANTVLAAPNGAAGVPTFRAIVAADIPTLNQNTTGTASNVTGTVAVGNGGTGATTLSSGYLLKGNGTSAVAASVVYDDGTNVGIGTSSPSAKLTVTGTAKVGEGVASNTSKLLVNTLSGVAAGIQLFQDANESWIIQNPASTNVLTFGNSGTERMRIDSSGNVTLGIGGGAKTVLYNDQSIASINTAGSAYTDLKVDGLNLLFRTGSGSTSERMRIDATGNVGIGTSSPASKLDVNGQTTLRASVNLTSGSFFAPNDNGLWMNGFASYGSGITSDAAGTAVRLWTSGAERMRIDSSGKLQLNTTSTAGGYFTVNTLAQAGLDIYRSDSSANYTGIRFRDTTNANTYGQIGWDSGGLRLDGVAGTMYFSTSGTERMRIDSSGNVGIGTASPLSRLTVSGGYFTQTNGTITTFLGADGTGSLFGTSTNHYLRFITNDTERMRIDASGNVMVGGTSALQSAKITAYGSVAAQNGGVDGTFANAFIGVYSANSNEHNVIQTAVSSVGTGSGFRFRASLGGGSSTTYPVLDLTRNQTIFYTDNAERMRLNTSGNLLVGTSVDYGGRLTLVPATTPTTFSNGATLQIGEATNNTAYRLQLGYINHPVQGYVGSIQSYAGGVPTALVLQGGGGNVGINTASPGAKLETFNDVGGVNALRLNTNFASGNYVDINPYISGVSNGGYSVSLNGVIQQVISYGGNFGIGTSSPAAKLEVTQNQAAFSYFDFYNTTASGGVVWRQIVRNIANSGTTSVDLAKIGSGFLINNNDTNAANFTAFGVGGSERMRIDSSGNVGVGTSSPSNKLDVFGTSSTTIRSYSTDTAATTYAGVHAGTAAGVNSVMYSYQGAGWYGLTTNHPMLFMTNNSERMRIDSSGNVGIGTTAGAGRLNVLSTSNAQAINILNRSSDNGYGGIYFKTSDGATDQSIILNERSATNAASLLFYTKPDGGSTAERMRIDASGNFVVGASSAGGEGGLTTRPNDSAGAATLTWNRANTASTTYAAIFRNANADSGTISYTNTATSYNTSSDVRLKHDIIDAPEASSLIDAIQVRSFKWNADNTEQRYGFVAQELVTVAPEAVSQPEDPDAMMGVDYSKLVPMLVKEIQSLRARVAQLEGN